MINSQVSVIIPAYNEAETITSVIELVKSNKKVTEIIVIDNASDDLTYFLAKECNVKVYKCNKRGKGYAMEKGLQKCSGNIVVFLDADLRQFNKNIIDIMLAPILKNNVDFVKTSFDRKGGRVTELVAKPLLKVLFSDSIYFDQPLSGMIAGKTELFKKMCFEKDYGVDVGILLDAIRLGACIKQVHIGKINHVSQDWLSLNRMSEQVISSIMKRKDFFK